MNPLAPYFDPTVRFQRQYAEHLLNRFRYLPCPGAHVLLEDVWVAPRGLNRALGATPLIVTGAPGAGKTTTLTHLAVAQARALLEHPHARVPIFFAARELDPDALPRPSDLPRALNISPTLAAQCPRDFFAAALANGRVLMLVDDLDALPPASRAAWLGEFAAARVVATSAATLAGWNAFALPGWNDGDLRTFAQRWDAANASAFLAALDQKDVPRSLSANPLTLTLLARVWRAGQPLPTRRTDLFQAVAHDVLGESDELARLLEETALATLRGTPAQNGCLAKSRGFLRAGKNRTADFVHDLWRAYFAARALRRSSDFASLAEHLSDSAWRETILFYAGLGDASALVDALVARGDFSLAGYALAHARTARADLFESVTRELISRAWEMDARATAALAEMPNPLAVDEFATRLKEPDPTLRARAVDLLGQLQTERSIEYLLPRLRDPDAAVRVHAIHALGRARTDRVVEPLLVVLRGDARLGQVDSRLRAAAARALGEIGAEKAVPALVVELQTGAPEVRAAAAEALARLDSPLASESLSEFANAGDELARAALLQMRR